VVDLCRSELVVGKEELATVASIDDISLTIPEDVKNVLSTYDADLATWEHAQFILQNDLWGTNLVLTKDVLDNDTQGKVLVFDGPGKLKIETFIRSDFVEL